MEIEYEYDKDKKYKKRFYLDKKEIPKNIEDEDEKIIYLTKYYKQNIDEEEIIYIVVENDKKMKMK